MLNFSNSRFILILLAALLACPQARAETVEITLLHLNDVYEITRPGKKDLGGLARVASLRKQLKAKNPNTLAILAGDFFSPSALGTAVVDGERLDGRQMVDVLNTMGLDYATFGNHEFDIHLKPFLARLKESRFGWFSSNTTDSTGTPFPGVKPHQLLTFKGKDGAAVRLALFGVTVETGKGQKKGKYWNNADYLSSAKKQMAQLKGKADIVVAITHLNLSEDVKLAREVPGIHLILGGHEHENNHWRSSKPGVPPIFKADANVRTVYVHNLRYDTDTRALDIESQLLAMSNAFPEDPATAGVVDGWVKRAFAALEKTSGGDPRQVVVVTTDDLEGRESYVRRRSTNLTQLIARAFLEEVKGADLAVYNSGMIRIDDLIPPGALTRYDVLRILPYGGDLYSAEIQGSMLRRLFDKGLSDKMQGEGAFLQTAGVKRGAKPGEWLIGEKALEPERFYKVAVNDYLLKGKEKALAFLGQRKGEVKDAEKVGDLRLAVMAQMRRDYPPVAAVAVPVNPVAGQLRALTVLVVGVGVLLVAVLACLGVVVRRLPVRASGGES
jgi:5'-nucleotidase